jgi:hypothetical protein
MQTGRQAGNKALDEKQMHDVTREDTISKVHFKFYNLSHHVPFSKPHSIRHAI